MEHDAPRIRRVCLAAARHAGRRVHDDPGDGLATVLAAGCRAAGLEHSAWRRPESDAGVAVLPPGVDEGAAISGLVFGLTSALTRRNAARRERLRLRVAL